ncbi:hypothetical protein SAMN04488034_1032 [Salinimicrobium catena]|uniref:Uncharacterized protein n=1 Tax=Salinimicrobium catena TaxID=390640 RepID=A0A1H5MMV7_9FLAO|nr:hypothetical protein [Salinimicrobium catena]SDL26474.1 hypothetical protein SAMN04488140_1032 [Salinimicrobium catena]SEE90732.1 hypothetical protein SAMN04488034_1032 [Salinimicrobium catena]
MRRFCLILLAFICSNGVFGQEISKEDILVGFACGVSADKSSKIVKEITELLEEKDYNSISEFLFSKNSGKVFLAIIVLERLDKYNYNKLNSEQKERIRLLKEYGLLVYNCWGCSSELNTLNEILQQEVYMGYEEWLEEIIPIK